MKGLNASLELPTVLQRVAAGAQTLSGAAVAGIALWDPSEAAFIFRYWAGEVREQYRHLRVRPGDGLGGRVAAAGRPVRVPDYPAELALPDPYRRVAATERIRAMLGVPIGAPVAGILYAMHRDAQVFTTRDERVLGQLADHAALAIANAGHQAAATAHARQLEAVRVVTVEMTRELDVLRLLELIYTRAAALLGTQIGAVYLWDEAERVLVPRLWRATASWLTNARLREGEGVAGLVAQRRVGVIENDYRAAPHALPCHLAASAVTAILAEPLLYQDQLLGVIALDNDGIPERRFTAEDQQTLRLFAAQAAIALQNARLYTQATGSLAELRRTQAELIRAEKLRALGQMAAGMAHDLNNTLAAALGQTNLLQLHLGARHAEELQLLETALGDAAQIVRRLQDFARQRDGGPLDTVDLRAVVRDVVTLTRPRWQDEPQLRGAAIAVETRCGEDPLLVRGRASEMREALTNILLNAVDAMPAGGTVTISAGHRPAAEAGAAGWMELTVRDTGVGMSPQVQQRAFDPFFSTKGAGGTGLGLSVVYGILERHGGRVHLTSGPGAGTTVTLQFVPSGETPPPAPPGPAARTPRHVLLVDDNAPLRTGLARLLRAAGHSVAEAGGGRDGLALFTRLPPDVVITDLGMPDLNGWALARAVKAASATTPVIVLTGWALHASGEGDVPVVDLTLVKPVPVTRLLEAIDQVTGRAAA